MTPQPQPQDPRLVLWVMGGVFSFIGIFFAATDNPIVPLWYVFHILPISIGVGILSGLLQHRFGAKASWAIVPGGVLVAYLCVANETSIAPVFFTSATYSLTRAILATLQGI